jgi:transglutaminase-like putative cysteine protease
LSDGELLPAISSWVGANLHYVPGSSRPTDGAVATLLAREGVCRDYAHLTTALLRANGIPARVVSMYAPGLVPMDFHAVTEVCLGRSWFVVDPTCLAPRSSMVRIATGADATDTAFMSTLRGQVDLVEMQVTAYVTGALPTDDVRELATIR